MARKGKKFTKHVSGPDGSPLTLSDLPTSNTRRWVSRRKAEVVAAVDGGLISLDEARQRYSLSVEEFLSWQRAFDRFGQQGLRATKANDKRIAVRPRALARDNARVLRGN